MGMCFQRIHLTPFKLQKSSERYAAESNGNCFRFSCGFAKLELQM